MKRLLARLHLTHPGHFVSGLTIWGTWFVAVYGGLSVACAVVPPDPGLGALTSINASLLIVSAITAACLVALSLGCFAAAREHAGRQHFNALVSAWLYAFSAVAVVFVALPIIGVPPCL